MDKNRIIELAIEALERQKSSVDAEIEKLRSEIKDSGAKASIKAKTASPKATNKRTKSAAERKALSEKMKKIWAERKAKKAKGKAKAKTKAAKPKPAKTKAVAKVRARTDAEKKALSLKMKEVWKKKKAAAAAQKVKA